MRCGAVDRCAGRGSSAAGDRWRADVSTGTGDHPGDLRRKGAYAGAGPVRIGGRNGGGRRAADRRGAAGDEPVRMDVAPGVPGQRAGWSTNRARGEGRAARRPPRSAYPSRLGWGGADRDRTAVVLGPVGRRPRSGLAGMDGRVPGVRGPSSVGVYHVRALALRPRWLAAAATRVVPRSRLCGRGADRDPVRRILRRLPPADGCIPADRPGLLCAALRRRVHPGGGGLLHHLSGGTEARAAARSPCPHARISHRRAGAARHRGDGCRGRAHPGRLGDRPHPADRRARAGDGDEPAGGDDHRRAEARGRRRGRRGW